MGTIQKKKNLTALKKISKSKSHMYLTVSITVLNVVQNLKTPSTLEII